jgi:predicted RNA methylase
VKLTKAKPSAKPSAEKSEKSREPKPAADAWLFQSPPGLAAVLKRELVFRGALDRKQDLFIKRQRNHDLLFANKIKSDAGLSKLRTAEAAFRCPIFGRYKVSQRQLQTLADDLQKVGPRRLVVSVAGRVFNRQDLSRWLEKEVSARGYDFDPNVEEEVWMFCIDEAYYFGVPITKARETEGREHRSEERHGSLPPPVAAALAFAGMPKPGDVILDPVCGSGTLLAEAYAYAPEAKFIGRDLDSQAVAIARSNLSHISEIDLAQADSRRLELKEKDVSLVLANFPFGVQFGDKKTNPALYRDILHSCLKLARPEGWRAVLFTSDIESLRSALVDFKDLETQDLFKVKVRGEIAYALLAKRKSAKK